MHARIIDFLGGELQYIKHSKKDAQQLMESNLLQPRDIETVSYDKAGRSVIIQGAELCHQVTAVQSGKEDRISLVISLMPANVYRPDRYTFQVN